MFKKLKDMRIRKRLVSSFVVASIIGSIASVLGVITIFLLSVNYEYAMKNFGFSQGDIGKAMAVFTETRSCVRGSIGYDDEEFIANAMNTYETKKAAFSTYMADLEEYMVTDDSKASFNEIMSSAEEYFVLAESILQEGSTTDIGKSKSAQSRAINELAPLFDDTYNDMLDLMNVNIAKGDI